MASHETILTILTGAKRLEWTVLRRRKTGYEKEAYKQVELDLPENAEERAAALPPKIKEALGPVKGHCTLIVPTDRVLLRVVELPSSDPDELAGMVELQVDKFSPFPIEHMAVGYEVLGGDADHSRVLIAACKREVVDDLGDAFRAAGHPPDRIDVSAAGWWRLMHDEGVIPAEGRHGLLLLEETGVELVITQNGLPVVIRSLGGQHGASDEEFHTELAEETSYTFTTLESEWGAMAAPDLTVWYREHHPAALVEKLQQECGIHTEAKSFDALPALTDGVAKRESQDGAALLDLSPPEWKSESASRSRQRKLITIFGSLMLVWLALLAALFLLSHFDRVQIDKLRAEIAAQEGPAEEARVLRRRVESLEQYADRTYSALEVLREVTFVLPREVDLTSFTYRKGGQVNLRGESSTVPPIYDFFEALEQSPLFVEVKPEGVTQAPGGRRKPEFRLTARLPGDGTP